VVYAALLTNNLVVFTQDVHKIIVFYLNSGISGTIVHIATTVVTKLSEVLKQSLCTLWKSCGVAAFIGHPVSRRRD